MQSVGCRSVMSVGALLLLVLGSCVPGTTPRSVDDSAVPLFPGIADHMAYARDELGKPLHIVLIHGMSHGTPGSLESVESMRGDVLTLAAALGASDASTVRELVNRNVCGVQVYRYDAEIDGAVVHFHEINYTAYLMGIVTDEQLRGCAWPRSDLSIGKNELYREDQVLLRHAGSWSASIKNQVVTWGLSDAAVYLHELTRFAIVHSVAQALDGIGTVTANDPVVFIARSLGSRVLFDALIEHYSAEPGLVGEPPQLINTHTIYFLANQLPLLELGAPVEDELVDLALSMEEYIMSAIEQDQAVGIPDSQCDPTPRLYFVAFSDPNDFLTFRITPTIDRLNERRSSSEVEFVPVDVVAGNTDTLLGLIGHPLTAHSGHLTNSSVVDLLVGPRLEAGACRP